MPLHIIREDITKLSCDAIVNPTNSNLDGSGSLDALIHKKAGCEIDKACKIIGKCKDDIYFNFVLVLKEGKINLKSLNYQKKATE